MEPTSAFNAFVRQFSKPDKTDQLIALASLPKRHRKLFAALCDGFQDTIRHAAIRKGGYDDLWMRPCFVFHERLGFGLPFPSVRAAYDALAVCDGWLIVTEDASAGIHRPEGKWDDEIQISV